MEIVETKRLKDGLNFVIEYMEDGQLHCLFISAEKVVKNYKAVEQSVERTVSKRGRKASKVGIVKLINLPE